MGPLATRALFLASTLLGALVFGNFHLSGCNAYTVTSKVPKILLALIPNHYLPWTSKGTQNTGPNLNIKGIHRVQSECRSGCRDSQNIHGLVLTTDLIPESYSDWTRWDRLPKAAEDFARRGTCMSKILKLQGPRGILRVLSSSQAMLRLVPRTPSR